MSSLQQLEISAEQVLLGSEVGCGESKGEGGRNDPNNVYTC
jgi:hypothetical protein